jgi:hypothetical protein
MLPGENPTYSKVIEANFLAALERISAGKPVHPELAAKKVVKVNYFNVAVEAGHSRTLIGHDGCAYQEVRDKIKSILKPELSATCKSEGPSRPKLTKSQELIENLRTEKKKIARERDMLATQLITAKLIIAEYEKHKKRRLHSN